MCICVAREWDADGTQNELPEYYQVIQLPIALETIEAKLQQYAYPNMSAIEADLKRMISNAKQFNEKNSEVHNDAEKIRKLVSNQFKELNPAYADPNYTAIPTPLPGEPGAIQAAPFTQPILPPTPTPVAASQNQERPKRTLNLRGPKDPTGRGSQGPATVASTSGNDFAGQTFQQAQENILQELIDLKNDKGDLISGNFLQLPSRALKDYYAAIKNPESLHGLKKKATGKQGHLEPTGVSLMKSWTEFEDRVGLIWRNARQYNEDGSDISVLAGQLEKHFNKRLAEAKAVIADPNRPKVKLNVPARSEGSPAAANVPSRITLNVGPKPSPGRVTVDAEALKRQQEMINHVASTAGTVRPGSGPLEGHRHGTAITSQSPPLQANGIKPEVSTPGVSGLGPSTLPQMPIVNGTLTNGHMINGMPPPNATARPPSANSYPPATPYYQSHPSGAFDSVRVRAQGKSKYLAGSDSPTMLTPSAAADALISSLSVSTHPSLTAQQVPADDQIDYTFSPSDRLTQQSFTFAVTQPHSFIRVQPTIQPNHAETRSVKLGVLYNGHKVNTVQQQFRREIGKEDMNRPTYDIPLQEGQLNRIEVWMLAGPARGARVTGAGAELEFEKYTLFIQRMKT